MFSKAKAMMGMKQKILSISSRETPHPPAPPPPHVLYAQPSHIFVHELASPHTQPNPFASAIPFLTGHPSTRPVGLEIYIDKPKEAILVSGITTSGCAPAFPTPLGLLCPASPRVVYTPAASSALLPTIFWAAIAPAVPAFQTLSPRMASADFLHPPGPAALSGSIALLDVITSIDGCRVDCGQPDAKL